MKLKNKDLFDPKIGAMDSSIGATSEDLATLAVPSSNTRSEEYENKNLEEEDWGRDRYF